MVVMGYHPGFEDDGVYLTAVKADLNPALYPQNAVFFQIQLQATVFARIVVWFVRGTGVPVAYAELFLQFLSIALIVFGCWMIARRLFAEPRTQWAGVAMVTAMFTLPVSGSALYLVDQHLHPRAMATGIILLAIARILSNKKWQAVPLLMLAFLLHPMMTAMGISFCIFLVLTTLDQTPAWLQRWRNTESGTGNGFGAATFFPLGWVFASPTPTWLKALNARNYLFLYRWQWYEWLGALAPLLLFWLLWRFARKQGEMLLARFALAVFLYGVFQQIIAMIVLGAPALIRLTPLQPMRYLHLVYFLLMLMGGCLLGKYLLKSSFWRWAIFLLAINLCMFVAQRLQFSSNAHLELPGRCSANPWLQAFEWIRQNTPTDAYFALDPNYLAIPGEDYHSFRALAERSQLADNIKDGSVVALIPDLGDEWTRQVQAQEGWPQFQLADFERLKAEFGVNWVLVAYPEQAGLACEWHNNLLAVCQIP